MTSGRAELDLVLTTLCTLCMLRELYALRTLRRLRPLARTHVSARAYPRRVPPPLFPAYHPRAARNHSTSTMPLSAKDTGAFPPQQAFDDQTLKVSDIHTIQWAQMAEEALTRETATGRRATRTASLVSRADALALTAVVFL